MAKLVEIGSLPASAVPLAVPGYNAPAPYEVYLEKEETGIRYGLTGVLPARLASLTGREAAKLIEEVDARLDSEEIEGLTLYAAGPEGRYYAEESEFIPE